MNAFIFRRSPPIAACVATVRIVSTVSFVLAASVFAQAAATPAAVPPQVEVPDGSPQLAQEKVISNTSSGATGSANPGRSASTVIVNEERIQGRLANARVSVGGARGYTIVDPDAGRSDRQSDNGGKRLSPSLWELFRF